MKWDIAFLMRNYPREYRFADRNYMMVDVDQRHLDLLRKHTASMPTVAAFFGGADSNTCSAVLFRIEADTEDEAIELTRHILEGFIDGLAMLVDRNLPKICPLLQVRRDEERDSYLIELGDPGWAYFQAKDPTSNTVWQRRCKMVFNTLFPFFDVIAQLFPKECARIAAKVAELWELRNEAVHEARAFDSDYLHEAPLLGPQIEEVELLFSTVVTFALANIDRANSVQALWTYAASFKAPEWAKKRPRDMPRMVMTKISFQTKLAITGGGALFDRAFTHRN